MRTTLPLVAVAAVLALGALGAGCSRGTPTEKRPISVIPDLEVQRKWRAQGQTDFFADGRMMRTPVEGTVPRGGLQLDPVYFAGRRSWTDSTLVARNPRPVDMQLLGRGRERFNIYCSPCHDQTGSGRGLVVLRNKGLVPPPSFHTDALREQPDGHFFDVMTNGIRTMPSYAHQIPVEDRWAIVAYIRALQRSQNATVDDVPVDKRGELR